ncbi:MAG: hypothetical protein K8S99_06355 [Planctomycetes bacterium]|nr:hypothetical protein [Planctomycetota bacterium]
MTRTHKADHQRWLLELTALPTASGREDRVIEWVRRWVNAPSRRRVLTLGADPHGNLTIRRRGARSRKPIYFTAHMDHPAFVVTGVDDDGRVTAEFRGGVGEAYFAGSPVLLHRARGAPVRGRVIGLIKDGAPPAGRLKRYRISLDAKTTAQPGDILTWETGKPRIDGDRLHVPACDDLAGVAAALAALDELVVRRRSRADVRVLLTRAEEIGFIGAIAAARGGTIARGARLVALEASKSFAESPLGAGPIVRVGDLTSTFDPGLTYLVGRVATRLAQEDPSFRWQRKLMPGGTCEATAYQTYGLTATCVCLALGNYHNMNEATQRIDAELIALSDFHHLVRLLVAVGASLDDPKLAPPLRERMESLFAQGRGVLAGQ